MPRKLSKTTILAAQATLEALNAHVKDYLSRLQKAEADIILQDKEIAAGHHDCFHYRPSPLFHHYHAYAPYSPATVAFKLASCEDDGIHVIFNDTQVTVPYSFDQKAFDDACHALFFQQRKDMAHCLQVKERAVKEERRRQAKDKSIRGPHKQGDYTYRWDDCPDCKGSGKTSIGTGQFEDDPFSYSDSPRQREITRTIPCPRCQGAQGLILYERTDGATGECPCNRWTFERNEDASLLDLLSGNPRRTR